ncbi:uncharacterized protein LOC128557867 [Mercenaria mercenaria]|uniref:uncharacterized protein LOC128557867 n=1 Tax=Mercenaria mercenaria TaxID=6596 RepID=UPI00234F5A69|nr:uncharacterized protein LOC128557867 [Mercenaria mercenaria]
MARYYFSDIRLRVVLSVLLIITLTILCWWSSGIEPAYRSGGIPYIKRDYGKNKNNLESRGKVVIKRYDLRIIAIVYNRAHSLLRLLNSLNEAEYGPDSIKLEVWIDRSEEGIVDRATLITAKQFSFKHGEYEVLPHQHHVGIYGQWFTTWKPDVNSSEIAVILEDDLTVPKYFWRYLKLVHQKYDKNADINGYSLQGYTITFSEKNHHTFLTGPKDSIVFLFPVVGAWGFSPSTKNWNQFLSWFKTKNISTFKPYVPDNIATGWYKDLSSMGRANTMWEIWHIFYAWKNNEFTLYCNFPGRTGLTTNWREKGLHAEKTEGSSNALITEWKTEYDNLPDNITYLDLAGNVMEWKWKSTHKPYPDKV